MKCPACNHDLPIGALFCPECGTRLDDATPTDVKEATQSSATETGQSTQTTAAAQASTAEADPAHAGTKSNSNESPTTPPSGTAPSTSKAAKTVASLVDRFKTLDKKIRYGIVGGGVAAVVIICIALALSLFGGPSTDEAKAAFMQSDLASNGAVPSSYTNETPYEVTDFKLDQTDDSLTTAEEQELARRWYGTDQIKTVTCSGTVANESFETSFTAMVYLAKSGNDWVSIGSPDILSKETKPLKGVDVLEEQASDAVSYSDFSSTLDESNGTYTSTASGTQTHSFWFAADTATVQQSFTFDQTYGWKTMGNQKISDKSTTWNLEGKTFECSRDAGSGYFDGTITFGAVEGESANADYSLALDANSTGFVKYKDASVKGSAAGRITHEFGEESFDIQLEDNDNSVALSCSCSGYDTSDGNNEIRVTGDTKAVIYSSSYGNESHLSFTSYPFEEKIETNA